MWFQSIMVGKAWRSKADDLTVGSRREKKERGGVGMWDLVSAGSLLLWHLDHQL